MVGRWHQAYEDVEDLLGQLASRGSVSDITEIKASAYIIMLRLFTEPQEDGKSSRLEYNSFVSADLWAGSHQTELLVRKYPDLTRRTIVDTVRLIVAFALNNANNGRIALAECNRVLETIDVETATYPPRKIDLILAYLGTGQAQVLLSDNRAAEDAFRKAWELLSRRESGPGSDDPPPAGGDGGGASTPPSGVQSKPGPRPSPPTPERPGLSSETGETTLWFLSELFNPHTRKIEANLASRDVFYLLGKLTGILVAKELARIELGRAGAAICAHDRQAAENYFAHVRDFLRIVRMLVREWPKDVALNVGYLEPEISMLEAIQHSADPDAVVKYFSPMSLSMTMVQRRDMVSLGKDFLRGLGATKAFDDVVRAADDLFVQSRKPEKLRVSSKNAKVALEVIPSLVVFDDFLSDLSITSIAIEKIYREFKSQAAKTGTWSWSETIRILADVLQQIRQAVSGDSNVCSSDWVKGLLKELIALVKGIAKLHDLGIRLEPIYEVIRDWPLCPDNEEVNVLVGELRRLG